MMFWLLVRSRSGRFLLGLIRGEIKARRRRSERYKRTWVGGISAITRAGRLGVYRLRLGWIYSLLPVRIARVLLLLLLHINS